MNYLKLYREKSGISQEEMCEKLGIPRTTYRNYENGLRSVPEDVANDIVKILKVKKSEIFKKKAKYKPKKQDK